MIVRNSDHNTLSRVKNSVHPQIISEDFDYKKFYIHAFLILGFPLSDRTIFYFPETKVCEPTPQQLLRMIEVEVKSIDCVAMNNEKIGIPLSGGIDSSTITLLLSKIYTDRELYTYTVAPGENYGINEAPDAKKVSEKYGTIQQNVYIDDEKYIQLLQETAKIDPVPTIGSPFLLATLKEMREDGINIVVFGEGGDELLGGYYPGLYAYEGFLKYHKFLPTALKPMLFFAFNTGLPKWRLYRLYGDEMKKYLKIDIYTLFKIFFDLYDDPILSLDLIKLVDVFNRRQKEEQALCEHFGLKAVYPFLSSREFIDYCYSIPRKFKMNKIHGKLILRKALEDFLPKSIVWKKKTGFGLGKGLYHTKTFFSYMESVFDNSLLVEEKLLRRDFIDKYLERNRKNWGYYTLLRLLPLELWCRGNR